MANSSLRQPRCLGQAADLAVIVGFGRCDHRRDRIGVRQQRTRRQVDDLVDRGRLSIQLWPHSTQRTMVPLALKREAGKS